MSDAVKAGAFREAIRSAHDLRRWIEDGTLDRITEPIPLDAFMAVIPGAARRCAEYSLQYWHSGSPYIRWSAEHWIVHLATAVRAYLAEHPEIGGGVS